MTTVNKAEEIAPVQAHLDLANVGRAVESMKEYLIARFQHEYVLPFKVRCGQTHSLRWYSPPGNEAITILLLRTEEGGINSAHTVVFKGVLVRATGGFVDLYETSHLDSFAEWSLNVLQGSV